MYKENLLKQKKAFTLVELIVVIVTLAILGTIAFISLGGYNKDARDSKRITDISNIKKALEVYALKNSKYPDPTSPTPITYSGSEAWVQGIFGTDTQKEIKNPSGVPTDPLTGDKYTYSVLNNKKEYELGAVLESDLVKINNYTANADGKIAKAYVRGNFNGTLIKVEDETTGDTYILAVPSIITSDLDEVKLEDIIANNKLVFEGKANLPASYSGKVLETEGAIEETIVNPAHLVVYTGDINTLDTDEERETFMTNLQAAYSGTTVANTTIINNFINIDTDNEVKKLSNYVGELINNELGGNVEILHNAEDIAQEQAAQAPQDYSLCENMDETNVENLNTYFSGNIGPYTETEWCALTSINLVNKNLGNVPSEIGYLKNLTSLTLQGNSMDSIPGTIGNLSNLGNLKLYNNQITFLPTTIGNLTSLHTLDSSENLLALLPSEIGNLTGLKNLWLNSNSLTSLPDELGNLTSLQYLYLERNELEEIPTSIENLANLKTLYLFVNKLTTLPDQITQLQNLNLLYISDNDLIDLPTNIGNLSSLTTLELERNNLIDLPSSIGNISTLQKLRLTGNSITELPSEIGNLNSLSRLWMVDNKLTELPSTIGNLSNLNWLDLKNNQITLIPSSIGNLSNLTRLNLDKNNLNTLPIELANLNNLNTLYLGGTGNSALGNLNTTFYNSTTAKSDRVGAGGENINIVGNGTTIDITITP